jgi:hypothetical protein
MNLQRRSIFAIVIVFVILIILFVFNQFLYLEPPRFGQPLAYQLTTTSIIATNHMVETFVSQTQTATAQVPTGTFTPSPTP